MTEPASDPPARRCGYCDAEFEPRTAEQAYCRLTHQKKAAHRRRHGLPLPVAGREVTCPWCQETFTTRDQLQAYCCDNHRHQHRRCRRKESFFSAEAAEAMARLRALPARGGELWYYPCPGPGRAHWHLHDKDKVRARKAALAARVTMTAGPPDSKGRK